MSSVKHKYRFYVDDTRVYPVWSNGANLKWTREGEFVFLRLKLNGTFTLVNGVRKDFNLVWAQDLDHEFTFRAEYIVDGVIAETINGTFFKTDCPLWDEDNERVDIVVQTIDRYEKLMKAFDKEFDVLDDLQPEVYAVNYKKEPLIQIAFPYLGVLFNRAGTSSYLTELTETYDDTQLGDFGFISDGERRLFIPGNGDMSPDVSGVYERQPGNINGADFYERTDGIYRIYSAGFPIGGSWYIEDIAANNDHYEYTALVPNTALDYQKQPFIQDIVFENQNDALIKCACFPYRPYQRVLTDATTIGVTPTIALPQPDINDLLFGYDNYVDQSGFTFPFVLFQLEDLHSVNPTKFGRFAEDAIHFADEYFSPTEVYPTFIAFSVNTQYWKEYSLMGAMNSSLSSEFLEAATHIALRDSFALADVIKLLLGQIDSTLYFEATAFASSFLFNTTNPITLEAQAITHFITPKSNIKYPDYSQPDTKEFITFGDIDQLLKAANLYWWIDNLGNFRIEHIAYFKNGRSYDFGTPFIGVNLTTLLEPRTGKYWGYKTNKYRYTKEKMPEQINFGWMDTQSEYFDGVPIRINSNFVEKGLIPDKKVSKFSSDISLASAIPDRFSDDGFFVFGAEFTGGVWGIAYTGIPIGALTISVQNGWWAYYYLHNKFWGYNLPAEDVNINNEDVTATTTKRGKEQSLVFPAGVQPDPMRLITSGIGNCEVEEMEINLASRKCTIKALGDLDFNNPCPTC